VVEGVQAGCRFARDRKPVPARRENLSDAASSADVDTRCPLKVALARAFRWQKMIESGEAQSNCDVARKLKLDQSYVARTIRLASLAPDIVEAILRGEEPSGLSLRTMRGEIPLDWEEQRACLVSTNMSS
jgi:hypothetical protein